MHRFYDIEGAQIRRDVGEIVRQSWLVYSGSQGPLRKRVRVAISPFLASGLPNTEPGYKGKKKLLIAGEFPHSIRSTPILIRHPLLNFFHRLNFALVSDVICCAGSRFMSSIPWQADILGRHLDGHDQIRVDFNNEAGDSIVTCDWVEASENGVELAFPRL